MSRADHLRVGVDPSSGVVALVGELTFTTVPTLDDLLREHLPAHPDVVLDVTGLTFCDSAGLSALIGATRRADLVGGGVTLMGLPAPLVRLLRLTGVEPLFTFAESAPAAFEGRGEPA
ncbi:STAS domain-containing protein [Pseudonocardia lacus]|uniref:STAS domain-containing protein n=1 Tax=Pseudonocardia lacus TaxID=2835865 RepID=UPI001BDBDAD6|nr:STAS domain-containing protein [Pseudonocardia lacus]